jgi:hypothetical protein
MAVNLSPIGGVAGQFFDNNGDPLVGGKLYTYAAGTTTPQATFTSASGATPNSNPIILNGGGRVPAEIWLTDGLQYKFVLYTSTDTLIGSWDNIAGINSNFVNFVTSEEVQTATAGQTVFTLTTMQYQPGTNNLVVYVDGVNQIEGGTYSFVETSSTVVTFLAGLHVGALVKFVSAETLSTGISSAANVTFTGFKSQTGVVQDIADDDGSDWIGFEPAGAGAVAMSVQDKLRETVSVKDFGAVGDGVTDDTAAIQAAQQASKFVYVPPGDYVVTGLRIYDQVNLFGAGYENTKFLQGDPAQPAINCLSDASVGQLVSIRLENFGVIGHASSTVATVKIEALGIFAIYRSHFDFIIGSSYQALDMQAITANNVFYCTFRIDVVGTTAPVAVVLNGGVYNTYDFFIANVFGNGGRMMQHSGFSNTFTRLVGDGTIFCDGQNTIFINPTIENFSATTITDTSAFVLSGFNQTLITPTVILNATDSAKISYCMKTFSKSLIINPRFLVNGTANPFAPLAGGTSFELQGPGQNGCTNKMDTIFTGAAAATDLRLVSKVGDVSAFIAASSNTYSGKSTQYLAPSAGASINYQILNSTDSMIFEPAGTVTLININLGYAGVVQKQGQTLSIFTSQAITTLNWTGNGSDVSLLPASMTAGQAVQFVYDAVRNKWYPC